MDGIEVKIYASGFLFSDILGRASSCEYDTEGILLGHESYSTKSDITDTQSSGEKKDKKIVIQSCVHSENLYSFYDENSEINLRALASSNKKFLGWYKVRRNTRSAVSLKENTINSRILKDPIMDKKRDILFLLLTPHSNDAGSTLSYPYKCFICKIDSPPQSKKINVINIGEGGSSIDYHDRSLLLSNNPENQLHEVQQHHQPSLLDDRGCIHQVKAVYTVLQSAMSNVKELQQELTRSQATVHHLEDDIQRFQGMADEEDQTCDEEDGMEVERKNDTTVPRGLRRNEIDNRSTTKNQRPPVQVRAPHKLYAKTTNL